MSLLQGGSGYPFFAQSLFEYLAGKDICEITPRLDEIPDAEIQIKLTEVNLS